jgi:DNA-binding MarR family transcriptional regulator
MGCGAAMNLRQLQTLITIADAGGFAGAAGRLHLSQPAASRQIRALEAELGVLLFDRIGRRLQLTSEGEDIVRRGRRLLQEADSLRDRADALKGGLTGTLRVGASPQNIETVLAPFVTRFRSKHPSTSSKTAGHASATGSRRATCRSCLPTPAMRCSSVACSIRLTPWPWSRHRIRLGGVAQSMLVSLRMNLCCSCTAGSARAAGSTPLVTTRMLDRQSFWKAPPRIP